MELLVECGGSAEDPVLSVQPSPLWLFFSSLEIRWKLFASPRNTEPCTSNVPQYEKEVKFNFAA
jgi:hypothetical protein